MQAADIAALILLPDILTRVSSNQRETIMRRAKKPTANPTAAAEPSIGHNSINAVDRDRLRDIVDQIESIEAERAELAEDTQEATLPSSMSLATRMYDPINVFSRRV
jgi:hypothetical protein